jgi:hypothetical protein
MQRLERAPSVDLDPEYETGDPQDDEVMRQLATRGPLDKPRHWIHFLPCKNESAAKAVAAAAREAGWTVRITSSRKDKDWCVTAEQAGVVTTGERVRAARVFFNELAERNSGAEYDGWQASV